MYSKDLLNHTSNKKHRYARVAEYGGINTMSSTPIKPIKGYYECPFAYIECAKKYDHVCSLSDESGNIYPVCAHRSCSTACSKGGYKNNLPLSGHQIALLRDLAKIVLPGYENIYYNREVAMQKNAKADYLIRGTGKKNSDVCGPSKLVTEVQGSVDVGAKKNIKRRVKDWETNYDSLQEDTINEFLRGAERSVVAIPQNSFRQLLGQIFQKCSMQINRYGKDGGLVACIGEPIYYNLYTQLQRLPDLRNKDWNLCFTTMYMTNAGADTPITIAFDESRTFFTDLDSFRNLLYSDYASTDDFFVLDKLCKL